MSKSKITGVIDGISDYKQKDFFNIALEDSEKDDNWYIGDGTLRDYGQFDKGDKVRITVDDNKGSVTNVEPVGKPNDVTESGASEADGSRGSDRQKQSYGGSTGSDSYVPPELQVALKKAVDTANQANLDLGDEGERAEHIDLVSGLTNGYYNILKDMGGEQ